MGLAVLTHAGTPLPLIPIPRAGCARADAHQPTGMHSHYVASQKKHERRYPRSHAPVMVCSSTDIAAGCMEDVLARDAWVFGFLLARVAQGYRSNICAQLVGKLCKEGFAAR